MDLRDFGNAVMNNGVFDGALETGCARNRYALKCRVSEREARVLIQHGSCVFEAYVC